MEFKLRQKFNFSVETKFAQFQYGMNSLFGIDSNFKHTIGTI